MGDNQEPSLSEELKLTFLKNDPLISETFARATFLCDIRHQLPKVSTPVCLLYCLEDAIVPQEVICYLFEHLPNGSTYKVAAKGHYPQMTNPVGLVEAIEHSLNQADEHSASKGS